LDEESAALEGFKIRVKATIPTITRGYFIEINLKVIPIVFSRKAKNP
jgi:hypothetical protein